MDTLIAFTGKDYVISAADCTQPRSILVYKMDEDKIYKMDDHKLLACAGEQGDRSQLAEYLEKNIALAKYRTGLPQSCHATANFIRNQMAYFLRKSPYQVNMLFSGYSEDEGPCLYYIDYLAAMQKTRYSTQGHGGNFALAALDRHWRPDMTLEEGKELMKECIAVLRTRFLVSQPSFTIKVVTAEGVQELDLGLGPETAPGANREA